MTSGLTGGGEERANVFTLKRARPTHTRTKTSARDELLSTKWTAQHDMDCLAKEAQYACILISPVPQDLGALVNSLLTGQHNARDRTSSLVSSFCHKGLEHLDPATFD